MLRIVCCGLLVLVGSTVIRAAEMNDAERAFVDQLQNRTMVGRFTVDGIKTDAKDERYEISKVEKIAKDNWLVTARIKFGKNDVEFPVPVKVHWAGDTPVLSVTDLAIPGLGTGFSTRVLFYKDHYAGSWYHGKVRGHFWGHLEDTKDDADDDTNDGGTKSSDTDEPKAD